MTKDLREALRVNKTFAVFFIFYKFTDNNIFLERSILESGKNASGNSIRYRKTFESQKDLVVKTIVPNLMKTLDLDTYPIGEGVIYEMIHQWHRHKRDNLRVKNKSENDIKKETGWKHQNS